MLFNQGYSRSGWWLGFLSVSLVPCALLADVGLALARGWRIQSRIEIALLLGLVAVVAGIFWMAVSRRRRDRFGNNATRLFALSLSLFLALFIVELLLHTIGGRYWQHTVNTREPNISISFHPNPKIMPGVLGESRYSTNSDGLRGTEMTSRLDELYPRPYRVICVGGSTTECTYLDDEETWPRQVMKLSNDQWRKQSRCWVGAAAVSGTTTQQHLEFVRESKLLDEVDCVVIMAGVNDLLAALAGVDPGAVESPPWLWSQLALPQLVVRTWIRWMAASRMETEDPDGRNYVLRREQRAAANIANERPDLRSALAGFRGRLAAIADACRQRGVEPFFVTQPVLWSQLLSNESARRLWMGRLPNGNYLSVSELRAVMDQYNTALAEVCHEQEASVIDLAPMNGLEDYFYDDCHFNEAGAAEVARRVTEGLMGKKPDVDPLIRPL